MGFESPDNLQISTRLGKPSTEQSPEVIVTPETPPPAALPEQDDFKISTRLQSEATQKAPAELAEPVSVNKIENPSRHGVLDALAKVLVTTPEELLARSTAQAQETKAPKEQPKPITLNIKFGDEVRVFNSERQEERGWTYAGKGENGTVRLVHGRNNGEHRDVTVAELQGWYKQSLNEVGGSKSAIESPTTPVNTASEQMTDTENNQISPEIIARAKEIIAKLETPGNMPAQLTKATEEILLAFGFTEEDLRTKTPNTLFEELRERLNAHEGSASEAGQVESEDTDKLHEQTETETAAEQEPLTQYLDIGDKVKIITESGAIEEDWTIEDIYTMSLASREVERAVIINTQGTHRTVEMPQLEAWNPAPEQPVEVEAEPDRSFHEGEEVLILSDATGELESGWHITYVSETVMGQKLFGFADVVNAEGVTKRIALNILRTWNTKIEQTKTETTASGEVSVELTNNNKLEHYSAEWIAQTLKQFNIDPEKLEGFAALTDGQKALVVENFQSMMMETITERAHKGLKTGNAFQRISKSWLKGIFVAKGKKEALTELEVGDEALKVQALRQLIDGMELLQPEIIVENGRMKKQYITPVNLGIDGPITPLQDVAIQRFNQAANDLAHLPVEWQKTGTAKEKKQFTEQTALFQKYSENLLREISKTQDAPAVELAILRAHFGIQMDQTLTAHPQVEKALLNIKSPKLWVEGLKSTLTERGLYAVGGSLTRLATVHALGAIGAPIAALAVGAWRAHDRSQDTLKERDRLARKGVADTSNERATMQPVVMDVDTRKANLSAEQKSLDQKIRKEQDNLAKTSDEKETAKIKAHIASMEERLAYLNNSIATTDESDLAGVSGGLTVKLEEMMMRIDLETDVSKRANLQMRLKRRIDYTAYQLERGLVNFGPAEERVVNHYRLMNAMGEALAGTWLDKTTLPQPELAKLSKYQLKVQNQIETFLRNQLSGTDKRRRSYITKEMIKGGLWGAGFALGGYLITKFAQEARVDHDLLSDNHHGTTGTDPEHLRQTAGTDDTAVTSPFQTASQTNIVEDGQTHLPTSLPTEHYTAAVERGSNVWKTTEHLLSEKFKDRFSNLNDAQKTYLIDSIKDKIQAHPEQFGLHAGQSIDQIQAGQVINFDAVMKDHSITSLLFDHAKSLNPEQMASIVHNNEILHHWIINNPSEALTADNVDSILQGTHYLGITPQALDQAIADGGSKILSIDQGLSPASTTAIINQILYGHPHGQEALMAQVKEALHDTHYLEAIDKAQHYDSGHMTAGWLQTLRGREWLDHHDGDVWNQDGAVYTVVKDVPAKTAKSLLARAYEAAKDQLESAGIPDEREPELVSFASNLADKTVDVIYRVE